MMEDLEALRDIFKDPRQHLGIGVITQMAFSNSFDSLRVQVELLPEKREIICFMGFNDVNDVTQPAINDLVIVAFVEDGHPESGYVLKVLNTSDDMIPLFAQEGHSVRYARRDKKLYLGSDTKICLARPDEEPIEPLVLGLVLTEFLTNFLDAILNAAQIGIGVTGPVFLDPGIRALLVQYKQQYLNNQGSDILSEIAFTERGETD